MEVEGHWPLWRGCKMTTQNQHIQSKRILKIKNSVDYKYIQCIPTYPVLLN